MTVEQIEWHRALGSLLDSLDKNDFWIRLVRLLARYVHFDSWVALCFSSDAPPLVLAESQPVDGLVDHLFEEYKNGIYILDPFYIESRENPRNGMILLDEVAPDQFRLTEYYQRYFRINVVEDELQINCLLNNDLTICLSLGSHQKFSANELDTLSVLAFWLVPLFRLRWPHEGSSHEREERKRQGLNRANFEAQYSQLTSRELEVLKMVLSGYSSKFVAQKLGISTETVKVHRKHGYAKLGVSSQSELFALFFQNSRPIIPTDEQKSE